MKIKIGEMIPIAFLLLCGLVFIGAGIYAMDGVYLGGGALCLLLIGFELKGLRNDWKKQKDDLWRP